MSTPASEKEYRFRPYWRRVALLEALNIRAERKKRGISKDDIARVLGRPTTSIPEPPKEKLTDYYIGKVLGLSHVTVGNVRAALPDTLKAARSLVRGIDMQRVKVLQMGVLGKEALAKKGLWPHRRPKFYRLDEGVLQSRGWRTESWGMVYKHVAGGKMSLGEACQTEGLTYDSNLPQEFRNKVYINIGHWKGSEYKGAWEPVTNPKTFDTALKNLAWWGKHRKLKFGSKLENGQEIVDKEEAKIISEGYDLYGQGKTMKETANMLREKYNREISRDQVQDFLADPDWLERGVVTEDQVKKVRQAKAAFVRPLAKRMRAARAYNAETILKSLKEGPLALVGIMEKTGLAKNTAANSIRPLRKAGLVGQEDKWHGKYYLTTQGRLHLATFERAEKLPGISLVAHA